MPVRRNVVQGLNFDTWISLCEGFPRKHEVVGDRCVICHGKESWINSGSYVYFARCGNCKQLPYEHLWDGEVLKCLFEPTTYEEMSCREYNDTYRNEG